jgi:hypothetical protein
MNRVELVDGAGVDAAADAMKVDDGRLDRRHGEQQQLPGHDAASE